VRGGWHGITALPTRAHSPIGAPAELAAPGAAGGKRAIRKQGDRDHCSNSGGYPLFSGTEQGWNLSGYDAIVDHWSRVLVGPSRSRRAFLDLMADPAPGRIEPYKRMAFDIGPKRLDIGEFNRGAASLDSIARAVPATSRHWSARTPDVASRRWRTSIGSIGSV
jgi:hypothetical protein